jgi:hypothetical protein
VRRLLAILAVGLALGLALGAPVAHAAQTPAPGAGSVVEIGRDAQVDGAVERVIVVGGDVRLGPDADVSGDVIVLFGDLRRDPGARVGGSEYVLSRSVIDWIPGPGWVAGLVLLAALLAYRAAAWAAVCAIAATLPRTASFERWASGWEPRPVRALGLGVLAVALALPALGLLAISGLGLPLALIGLAALLVSAGAGLTLFREGPLWPRRPGRWAYAAYLILPPALEIGLLLTAAGGLGAGIRALTRSASARR